MGPNVGSGCRRHRSAENIPVFERMALVITLYHKYVQLSDSNHALPIRSRIGVVMTLVLELWPIAKRKHVSF